MRTALATVAAIIDSPDQVVMRSIEALAGIDEEVNYGVFSGAQRLIVHIDIALAAPELAKEDERGRGKYDPGATSDEVVAMTVAVAWREARGAEPVVLSMDDVEGARLVHRLPGGRYGVPGVVSFSSLEAAVQDTLEDAQRGWDRNQTRAV